jgi:hypothetical protein
MNSWPYAGIPDVVLRMVHENLLLLLGLYVWTNGRFDALYQIGLFRLLQPGFDLCVIIVLQLLVPHFAKQKLSFELFPRKFFNELHQAGFGLRG